MNFRQLRYLIQVAETGSFSKAALQLNVAQPALSRQIKLLEEELGVPLFRRTGRGAEVTNAGRELVGRAIEIMQALLEAREAVATHRGLAEGEVRIGVLPLFGASIIPDLLLRCKKLYPYLKIHVEVGMSPAIHEWLISGRIDFGTISYSDAVSQSVKTREIFATPMLLVRLAEDEESPGVPISLDEALRRSLVLPTKSHGVRKLIDHAAERGELTPQPGIEVDSIEIIKGLLLSGVGSTILPRFPLGREIDAGLLASRPILGSLQDYRIALATSLERPLTPSATIVADLIAEISSELAISGDHELPA